MTDALYQSAILAHAKAAVGAGRLDQAHASATVDNPLCGDRVTVEVSLDDGRIAALAHVVRGCVLCHATASVLSSHAVGLNAAELHRIAQQFAAMIRNGGQVPAAWPVLQDFHPVRAAKSRHECVLLPFEAAEKAVTLAAG
ncbi:MAG: iron-sulfur cluster assembly scaffold protein [Alphaproteobacteria bacterium]